MIAEKFPELATLDPEDQLILAGELMLRATARNDAPQLDTVTMQLIEARLNEYFQNPDSGVRWEDLRDRKL